MTNKFNRKYGGYQPSSASTEGPPTNRICKPVKCNTDDSTTPPPSPPPAPSP